MVLSAKDDLSTIDGIAKLLRDFYRSFNIHMNSLAPELRDFILFCADRRGAGWPVLYDEMALVAGQRLFKGLGRAELEQLGLSLALDSLDRTLELVRQVVNPCQHA